jgi:hypothetical protein
MQPYCECIGLLFFNPLNADSNPICHFLALSGAHPIIHVSRIRVNLGAKWGGLLTSRLGRFIPGKEPVPSVYEAGYLQGRIERLQKTSPLLGFDPRTAQPVASRYTVCAIPALFNNSALCCT